MLGVAGCAHHQTTQAEREMMQILSLRAWHLQIARATDIREQFSLACTGFFESRQRWPGSLAELKAFWSFAPPEPYNILWLAFRDATLDVLPDGALSVHTPDGTMTLMIHRLTQTVSTG